MIIGEVLFMNKKIFLGRRIKELRKRKGISQEKLAELIGIEPPSVCNIENGKNYPTLQNLEKITTVLGVTYTDVFNFDQHQDPDDLIFEINNMMKNNPEKIKDFYKIIKALCE